jgi:diaminopimelate epimerase
LDARKQPLVVADLPVAMIADRRLGVGCDQLIILEPATSPDANLFMRIVNADGGEVDACGNATRCVGAHILADSSDHQAIIETNGGLLTVSVAGDGDYRVNMGPARLDWSDIPLAHDMDTLKLDIQDGPLSGPAAISMGNPHAVFFVDDVESIALEDIGPRIEHHPFFPTRTNVEAVQLLDNGDLRLRVWERGVGVTRACGTGACAALVAASRRGIISGREARIILDGGALTIGWLEDGTVEMTGPVAVSFSGSLEL